MSPSPRYRASLCFLSSLRSSLNPPSHRRILTSQSLCYSSVLNQICPSLWCTYHHFVDYSSPPFITQSAVFLLLCRRQFSLFSAFLNPPSQSNTPFKLAKYEINFYKHFSLYQCLSYKMYKLCDVSPTLDRLCECLLFRLVFILSHISFHCHKST